MGGAGIGGVGSPGGVGGAGGANRPSQLPAGGAGGGNWQHNPAHRGGAPYGDRATADRFGGAARGDSLANRQAGARNQIGRQGGNLPSNRGGASASNRMNTGGGFGGGNRGGGSFGGGSDRVGSRDVSRPSGGDRSAFGSGSRGGYNGSSARSASSRGSSSFGGGGRGGGGGGWWRRPASLRKNHEEHKMNSRSARKNLFELLWIAIVVAWACLSTQVLFGAHQASTGTQVPPAQSSRRHRGSSRTLKAKPSLLRSKPPMPSSLLPAHSTRPHSQRSSAPTARKSSSREKPPRTANEP